MTVNRATGSPTPITNRGRKASREKEWSSAPFVAVPRVGNPCGPGRLFIARFYSDTGPAGISKGSPNSFLNSSNVLVPDEVSSPVRGSR